MCRRWALVLAFLLALEMVLPLPLLQRDRRYIPIDFVAPLELPQKHFGLIDSYGIKPKHPAFRSHVPKHQQQDPAQAERKKRDEPNFEEYFYDDMM
ncbi:uncharacterized protein C11orf94 homolog [Rhinatrema bivittatum]|uniref:uncharacterized protein C11orf94 homolog n=1 Tax=Rhinatrema bivittatum TaxID=194408 RepID=UPI001127DC8D|nr:uncharacterized protein C11orf94 homolog [Rhinatrema bivittatum]